MMKITRKQLAKIIAEEKQKISTQKNFGSNANRQEKLREGQMKQMEQELIEEIIQLLEDNGAIQPGLPMARMYDEALYWIQNVMVPSLESMVDADHGGEI
jgi:hypothetical protein